MFPNLKFVRIDHFQLNNPGVLDVQFVGEYNRRGKFEPVCESKFEFMCDFISFVSENFRGFL